MAKDEDFAIFHLEPGKTFFHELNRLLSDHGIVRCDFIPYVIRQFYSSVGPGCTQHPVDFVPSNRKYPIIERLGLVEEMHRLQRFCEGGLDNIFRRRSVLEKAVAIAVQPALVFAVQRAEGFPVTLQKSMYERCIVVIVHEIVRCSSIVVRWKTGGKLAC